MKSRNGGTDNPPTNNHNKDRLNSIDKKAFDYGAIESVRFAYNCVSHALQDAPTESGNCYRRLLSDVADDLFSFISGIDLILAEVAE
jgi:hypothetical protein